MTAGANGLDLPAARPLARMCAVALLAALAASTAAADIIVLKNKTRLEGKVIEVRPGAKCLECGGTGRVRCAACRGTGHGLADLPCTVCRGTGRVNCGACGGSGRSESLYKIQLRAGVVTSIPESQIERIEKSDIPSEDLLPPRESYEARRRKLTYGDAAGELALARWALDSGLLEEAAGHAKHAAEVDESFKDEAAEIRDASDHKREARARRDIAAALEMIESGPLEHGLRELQAAAKKHADNPLLTDAAHERAFLAERAPGLVKEYGPTIAAIVKAATHRIRIQCQACSGAGSSVCAKCAGTGEGVCPRCKGAGKAWCPECNGTGWRLCIRCGGAGKVSGGQQVLGMTGACPDCRGRGVVACTRCKGGKIDCPGCAGKGSIPGACDACGGAGKIPCRDCLGTGLRRVTAFRWGPVGEFRPSAGDVGPARRVPVWQGIRRGCIVTIMRARDLHDGALTRQLSVVLGEPREFLLVCIDNRDGRDQVEFSPDRQGIRLVTDRAGQIEAVRPVGLAGAAQAHAEYGEALTQMEPTAVLPGVMRNAICVFASGTDFEAVESIYWGREEPWRLMRRLIPEDDLARLRPAPAASGPTAGD